METVNIERMLGLGASGAVGELVEVTGENRGVRSARKESKHGVSEYDDSSGLIGMELDENEAIEALIFASFLPESLCSACAYL